MTKRIASLGRESADGAGAGLRERVAQPRPPRVRRAGRQAAGGSWTRRGAALALLLLAPAGAAWAQQGPVDLTTASIEELMQVQVTSASKRQEKFFETAAAIYVISQEDIRRSGATSIPELLRMVPGMDVAQIDANKWAVSSRGFNERFADKMLVLIDGRTVYTPFFSGVYWEMQDTLLEDIERIEVIRGPGASLWGANAVNGVIIILTKPAKDTQGGLVTAGAGNQERGFGGVRYGGRFGPSAHYRFNAKYFNRGGLVDSTGKNSRDGWDVVRGEFRTDWEVSGRDRLTFQGGIYHGGAGQRVTITTLSPPFSATIDDRVKIAGGNVVTRWERTFAGGSGMTLQAFYDRTKREEATLGQSHHVFDLDFDHRFALGERQYIVWGLGYRFTTDNLRNSFHFSFNPASRATNLFSGFVQDEIVLVAERLRLTLGTKLEHNAYSGFEVQPNLRLLWTPHPHHAIWAAVSRAVESPSRVDANGRINEAVFLGADGTTTLASEFSNPRLPAESVLANELGDRAQLGKRLSLDVATFYNVYAHLHTDEPGLPFFESSPPPPHRVLPTFFADKMRGETHGIEGAANWKITPGWTLSASYTELRMHLPPAPSSQDLPAGPEEEGRSPRRQWQLRSYFKVSRNLEFDAAVYHVSRIPIFGVPSYTRLDLRLGWRPTGSLEISLVGQNLLGARHPEFGSSDQLVEATQVKRSGYGKLTWRF